MLHRLARQLTICCLPVYLCCVGSLRADGIDDLIVKKMKDKQIAGLSLAIVQDGKILKAQGYGATDKSGKTPVTATTLFQAGSVSKPVAATAAMHLVEKGKLTLDDDVNKKLRSWKVPDNGFTKEKKVTLREILSHSAGLNVHGFGGYAVNGPVPNLLQVLDGIKPANSLPIRVEIAPGSKWQYSGGGFIVMQQLILDVTKEPFPKFMNETVLKPFGMTDSTYDQALSKKQIALTAAGYYLNGKPVEGRWHVYPEMAAAGLWTTASDLALFEIGIQDALSGKANSVISQATAHEMLTKQKDNFGLGLFLQGEDKKLMFFHNGRDDGFDTEIVATASTGQGAVVMINANDDSGVSHEIVQAIAKEYRWP